MLSALMLSICLITYFYNEILNRRKFALLLESMTYQTDAIKNLANIASNHEEHLIDLHKQIDELKKLKV